MLVAVEASVVVTIRAWNAEQEIVFETVCYSVADARIIAKVLTARSIVEDVYLTFSIDDLVWSCMFTRSFGWDELHPARCAGWN